MQLLRELSDLQHEHGYLSETLLRELAQRRQIPLYHLEGLVSFYPQFRRTPPPPVTVRVCRDLTCAMAGCRTGAERLVEAFASDTDVDIESVSCLGRCDHAPALTVNDVPLAPLSLQSTDRVIDVVRTHPNHNIDPPADQTRTWLCNPYRTSDDWYATVSQCVSTGILPQTCIERLQASGLRGMGGAGFPTARKWELVRDQPTGTKYVICNADESEPGTFKDRVILQELPFLVIEGLLLAALTVGAAQGIVYIRHEYEQERRSLEAAIEQARRQGLLGPDAAGSGQAFDIEIFVSPGGYILGEETALLEALEDRRGEPRNKPPYPGTSGLYGRPTLINNVETLALATAIVHHGASWWKDQGCDGFSGLKFVSVSGDVQQPGVYEIPMGLTIAELISLAGGMRDGQRVAAVLPGGASSNFLTPEQLQTPLDFEAVRDAGSMLGTGAVIVIADHHDLYDLATNLVRFFRNESCGKCVPCRLGTQHAVELLEHVRSGQVPSSALDELPLLGETLEQTSICGLGQVALNPILTMLDRFPDQRPEMTYPS
ncbi:MAG: NADH-ubiquinone oxidoreductase-F iron-sulfur binding region domain-containing protein [Planctomycetaceae bacterium]